MVRRANRLVVLVLAAASLLAYHGCSQSDDIVTPVSLSVLALDSRLLPTPPAGMVYELWVKNGDDTVSIGRFGFDQVTKQYLTEGGQVRPDGNEFRFSGDAQSYEEIFISVENSPDGNPSSPANVMLWDRVTNPKDDPLRLVFPMSDSLWFATCQFSMESPSDGDRETDDGSGLWFAQYRVLTENLIDTLMLDSVTYEPVVYDRDTTYIADYIFHFVDTIGLTYTFDTIPHIRVEHDYVVDSVTDPPETVLVATPHWDTTAAIPFTVDDFTQGAEGYGLVDYTDYGFQYRGWVVSHAITDASVGQITLPAWDPTVTDDIIGEDGGLISTGPFKTAGQADSENPYAASLRIPPFPGEDFLENLPNGVAGPLNLLPDPTGNIGSVFITLEPVNFNSSTTNFPLIAFAANLPSNQSELIPPIVEGRPTMYFPMRQYTAWSNPSQGFPVVNITMTRY